MVSHILREYIDIITEVDSRTRAEKLRDFANHPNTPEHERQAAIAQLQKMGEPIGAKEPDNLKASSATPQHPFKKRGTVFIKQLGQVGIITEVRPDGKVLLSVPPVSVKAAERWIQNGLFDQYIADLADLREPTDAEVQRMLDAYRWYSDQREQRKAKPGFMQSVRNFFSG